MGSNATAIKTGNIVTSAIKVAGSPVSKSLQVQDIRVQKAINRISSATLTILDGSAAKSGFPVSSSDTFKPGKEIVIEAGYDNKNKQIFKGIITQQRLKVDNLEGPTLIVECKDTAVKMTIGRKSKAYSKVKDSDVMSQLIGSYSGLSANVKSTPNKLPELVQYYCTDWDFLLTRAEVNSLIVTTINGKVSVQPPDAKSSSVLTIKYGVNMMDCNTSLNSVSQLAEVQAQAWDYSQQKLISAKASNSVAGPGNISSKKLADVVGPSDFQLQTTAAESSAELTTWAKGQLTKSEYAKITGEVTFQGSEKVEPGVHLTLEGMGARVDGKHFVSGVVHDISHGNWLSEASLGMDPNWFAQQPDVIAPTAAGLLPGVQGLFNAVVKKIYEDPDSEYRIQVEVPLFDATEFLWARLSNFYSTSGEGAFFLPEVGDEVVVGFLNADPRYPVILGSLYSKKNKPFSDLSPDKKNSKKAIVTKSQLRIVFDDENKVLTITTPASNTVTLSDKDKKIEVKDQNSNSVTLSESGIAVKSPKNISIEADQKVSIKGKGGVSIESSAGDVTVKGNNVKQTANMAYSAKGNMTAQVQGGTQLTLKAAMVMIN